MPTNSPLRFTSAPPLFPGLITASVCINDSMGNWLSKILIFRPLALTIPAVTVLVRLNGLPTASTHCPISTSSELANMMGANPLASTLSSARSLLGSVPISIALYVFLLSLNTT